MKIFFSLMILLILITILAAFYSSSTSSTGPHLDQTGANEVCGQTSFRPVVQRASTRLPELISHSYKKSQHGCVRWALCEHLTSPCHDFAYGGLRNDIIYYDIITRKSFFRDILDIVLFFVLF